MGAKIGRNEPCPCGSGKKYKKCCLPREEEARARYRARFASAPDEDHLDDLSNLAADLIQEGRFDEAAQACDELRRFYPDMVDGLQRQAQLDDARDLPTEAAHYYRAAADFAEQQGGFDPLTLREWRERADALDPAP